MLKKIIIGSLLIINSLNSAEIEIKDIKIDIEEKEVEKNKNIIEKGITYSFGEGNTELYVFLDINKKSGKLLSKLESESKKIKVHVYLKPNKDTYDIDMTKKMSWILLGESDEEKREKTKKIIIEHSSLYKWIMAYKNLMETKELLIIKNDIKKTEIAIKELNVTEFPSVFDKDLKEIK